MGYYFIQDEKLNETDEHKKIIESYPLKKGMLVKLKAPNRLNLIYQVLDLFVEPKSETLLMCVSEWSIFLQHWGAGIWDTANNYYVVGKKINCPHKIDGID